MTKEEFIETFKNNYMNIDWKVGFPKLYEKQHFIGTRNDIEIKLYEPSVNSHCDVVINRSKIKVPKEIYEDVLNIYNANQRIHTETIFDEFWK